MQKLQQLELPQKVRLYYPGFSIACLVGVVAYSLGTHYNAPVMLFALLIGMAISFVGQLDNCKSGINFTASPLLRLGVGLLGVRIATSDILQISTPILISIPSLIALTILVGFILGKLTKKGWYFSFLTAGAVGICGASAALAISSILPKNEILERNTLLTVIGVTTLSTVAMILYPILFQALNFSDLQIGYLIGATIHDVAQVVGAGYSVSTEVGDLAVLIKLLRVTVLPVVILLGVLYISSQEKKNKGKEKGAKLTAVPWFVILFFTLAFFNSVGLIPSVVASTISAFSKALLIVSISALGIKTSFSQMAGVGHLHVIVIVGETLALLLLAMGIAYWLV
ncbi:MAG: putative sulfate exporter family transporter [Alphaproteobacteria bacterium]|nr:putative sulfate exporter family transporter [Alphaproteobacteria bacterium]